MDTNELDQLIITNLAEIEATWDRIQQLDQHIWSETGDFIVHWAERHGWASTCDDDTIKLHPPEWSTGDEESKVYFYLAWGPEDTGSGVPYSWSARFSGVSGGKLCLWLEQSVGARVWKPIARAAQAHISQHGFILSNGGHLYTECTLNAALLADGLLNQDLSSAFAPLEAAMNRARLAAPLVTPFLKQAQAL